MLDTSRTLILRSAATAWPVAGVVVAARLYLRDAGQLKMLTYAFTGAVVAIVAPLPLLAVSLASSFGFRRVAALGIDISIADVVLTAAAAAAARFLAAPGRRFREFLLVAIAFQVIMLVPVAANPTRAALFEWFHRLVLVGGAAAVGAAVFRTRLSFLAWRAFYAVTGLFAAHAISLAVRTGFEPAYPFGMQKNPAGLLMAFALLSMFVAPRLARVPTSLVPVAATVLLLGLLATRSRGAMIALLIASAIWVVRSGKVRHTLPVALAASVALVAVVYITTESEFEFVRANPEAERFRGIGARVEQNERAVEIWRGSPLVGEGLRYFRDPRFEIVEPHNVVLYVATESGFVGLVALGVLLGGGFYALRGLQGPLAQLARLALLMRFTAGLFDIYWVAGTGSLPWIIAGMALAEERRSLPESTAGRDERLAVS
ncbi:MAG TPA: O-antigen ligase family protein [Acidimicrobiales bacterium]|jgi:polysaccharide biosynthesis protein PslJ|nr:O-antigen ligase family protein [Acidimicrobiales bacterium]